MNIIKILLIAAFIFQTACATQTKNLVLGMVVGASAGAVVGSQLNTYGDPQAQSRNTIIAAVAGTLLAAGLIEWHYQQMEAEVEAISGKYARYRLCDPEDAKLDVDDQLGKSEKSEVYQIKENQIGKLAISLDDSTKWAYPIFRKRFLKPELGETQMTSERYIWEIIKPGAFVTRSQNPYYFAEPKR